MANTYEVSKFSAVTPTFLNNDIFLVWKQKVNKKYNSILLIHLPNTTGVTACYSWCSLVKKSTRMLGAPQSYYFPSFSDASM
jgi:hypothetical protein